MYQKWRSPGSDDMIVASFRASAPAAAIAKAVICTITHFDITRMVLSRAADSAAFAAVIKRYKANPRDSVYIPNVMYEKADWKSAVRSLLTVFDPSPKTDSYAAHQTRTVSDRLNRPVQIHTAYCTGFAKRRGDVRIANCTERMSEQKLVTTNGHWYSNQAVSASKTLCENMNK